MVQSFMQLPSRAPRVFAEWAKEYGPLMTLRRGNTIIIIISGQQVGGSDLAALYNQRLFETEAAIDIMEKENASLVDRPRVISAGETMSADKRILLVRSGERFRKLRKYVYALSIETCTHYRF